MIPTLFNSCTMASAYEFSERLKKINVQEEFAASLEKNKAVAIQMNQDQLYEKGIKADGTPTGEYAASTKKRKERKGQKTEFVTGHDTGEMYKDMFLDVRTDEYVMDSADPIATPHFTKQFGDKVFGLTDENKSILGKEYIQPDMVHSIAEKTGMGYGT